VTLDNPPPGYAPPPWPPPGYPPAPYRPGHPYAPPVAPNGLRLAEFGERLIAYLIDIAVLTAACMVVLIPLIIAGILYAADVSYDPLDPTYLLGVLCAEGVLYLVQLVLMYLYFVTYQQRSGQTLGKRVMKLKIMPLDPRLAPTRRMLQRRYLAGPVGNIIPGYGLLDGLWQLWDQPYRQCLHDKFAATVVVKLPDMVRVAG
jgi:uncharacterized RDD family membrane protein YckC